MPLTSTTTADTTITEIWSLKSADTREGTLVLANLFDRKYEIESQGKAYDTIRIQGINTFQDEASTHANTLGVAGTLTYDAGRFNTQVVLAINTHAYQAFDLETEAELMSNLNLVEKFAAKAGYAVAHRMDDDCAGMIDDFSNTVGALGTPLSDADIRRGVQYLDDAFAPMSDRFFYFSHAEKRNIEDQEKYINALYKQALGNLTTTKIYAGYMAPIYGMSWYSGDNAEGSNTAGHDNGMFHKEAVAFAAIDFMRVAQQYEIDTDSMKYAVHSIYGLIEARDDHGVFARGL